MTATTDGAFYVIQLAPDLAPRRVKLGWALDAQKRLTSHRCAAPTARLVNQWPCHRNWEGAAIRAITAVGCRALSREAFDVGQLEQLLDDAEEFFRSHDALSPRVQVTRHDVAPGHPTSKYWTVKEAAHQLRTTEVTIRRWIKSGKLRGRMPRLPDPGVGSRPPAARVERAEPGTN